MTMPRSVDKGFRALPLFRDVVAGGVFVAVLSVVAVLFDSVELFFHWTRQHETWELDEMIPFIFFFALAAAWFAARRLREARLLNRELEARVEEEVERRRRGEEALLQQGKVASMGELLNRIAHHWRQPLNVIALTAYDLSDAYEFGELDRAYLEQRVEEIVDRVQFLSGTISDFQRFYSPRGSASGKVEPGRQLEELVKLMTPRLAGQGILLELALPEEELWADGEVNDFNQVLLNLVGNAVDAVPQERGRISLAMERRGRMMRITVEDNGGGVPEALEERIFEPYFTTKEEGHGPGLGLYVGKMVVERGMNGRISLERGREGARFVVELPLASPPPVN